MARFAPVVPLQTARLLKEWGILGDYHLLLAHDVLDHPDEYRSVYSDLGTGACIILDNSVVELGSAMQVMDLARACDIIQPHFLVIPDVQGEYRETANMAEKFRNEFNHTAMRHIPLLGVVHGKSLRECRWCALSLAQIDGVKALSVPRIVGQTLGSRMAVLMDILWAQPVMPIHLLGFSDDILDDVACARVPGVIGIDSAVPIRAALQSRDLTLDHRIDYGPRGSYWDTRMGAHDKGLVMGNLSRIRRWIRPVTT